MLHQYTSANACRSASCTVAQLHHRGHGPAAGLPWPMQLQVPWWYSMFGGGCLLHTAGSICELLSVGSLQGKQGSCSKARLAGRLCS